MIRKSNRISRMPEIFVFYASDKGFFPQAVCALPALAFEAYPSKRYCSCTSPILRRVWFHLHSPSRVCSPRVSAPKSSPKAPQERHSSRRGCRIAKCGGRLFLLYLYLGSWRAPDSFVPCFKIRLSPSRYLGLLSRTSPLQLARSPSHFLRLIYTPPMFLSHDKCHGAAVSFFLLFLFLLINLLIFCTDRRGCVAGLYDALPRWPRCASSNT